MRRYPAKLLLFGEHVLLLGNSALATPVPAFSGGWEFGHSESGQVDEKLLQFADSQYLASVPCIDREAFRADLMHGLSFSSNIPVGYGLGSSGALCAAVYDRYCRENTTDESELKNRFSRMESFFHGSSSGIDPLTSYLQKPLLIQNKTTVIAADMKIWRRPPVIFLLDTRLPRQTGPLVNWFLEQTGQASFRNMLDDAYLPAHETVVASWIQAEEQKFWPALQKISTLQLEYFTPMVPESLRKLWVQSLEKDNFRLKICGAGGGGYMLGFSSNVELLHELQTQYELIFPFLANP